MKVKPLDQRDMKYLVVCRLPMSVKRPAETVFHEVMWYMKSNEEKTSEALILVVCFLKIPIQVNPVLRCLKNNEEKTSERNTDSWGLLLSLSLKEYEERKNFGFTQVYSGAD